MVVLDCKGGADARRIADRFRRVLRQAGARSIAIWPDEASLSLWTLPPRQLTTTLVDLIEHGTGSAAYYADVMEALIGLAVEAPCGPPASSRDLLGRLEPGWLAMAYASSGTAADHALIRSASRHLGDVALRFRTLFRRLGAGLDGPGGFGDADAWYCILEGTDQIPVAEGQARALVDLLASFAVRGPQRREILLAVDEFSAVSRRLPIWQLYERARSLGLAVQVSAQSWQGLAAGEDERYRIAASAEGGIWLLRTPHPEPLTALAGTRRATETTRRLARFPVWRHQGTSRLNEIPVVDAALIRDLDVGQAAYIYRGGVTYVQVKRLVGAPAAMAGRPAAAVNRAVASGRAVAGDGGHADDGGPASDGGRAPDGGRVPDGGPAPDGGVAGPMARPAGARPGTAGAPPDVSAVLGLDCGADLTDDEVRAVWRRIAAATHPDRADGGDPERFAAAAAAYTELRTRFGRGEARAALGDAGGWAHEVAVRLARGRPVRLALRVIVAAIAAASAILVTGHGPAGPALATGAATWLVLTGRRDLGSRVASAGRAGRGLRRGDDQPGSWPVATGRDGSDDQADQEPT